MNRRFSVKNLLVLSANKTEAEEKSDYSCAKIGWAGGWPAITVQSSGFRNWLLSITMSFFGFSSPLDGVFLISDENLLRQKPSSYKISHFTLNIIKNMLNLMILLLKLLHRNLRPILC
jgi:hypothetical protein